MQINLQQNFVFSLHTSMLRLVRAIGRVVQCCVKRLCQDQSATAPAVLTTLIRFCCGFVVQLAVYQNNPQQVEAMKFGFRPVVDKSTTVHNKID